jgi:hypothetical protein
MEFALLILSFLNFLLLIAISVFLVRFRDRVNNLFKDLIEAMEVMWGAIPVAPVTEQDSDRPKTWDEKYEEELEAMTRRLRADSGLSDLPDPVLSWGEPPAINLQNTDGLLIKDITKSPMNANRVDRTQ